MVLPAEMLTCLYYVLSYLTCLLAHSPVKLSAWTPRLTAHSVISAWCGTMTATTHDLRLSP